MRDDAVRNKNLKDLIERLDTMLDRLYDVLADLDDAFQREYIKGQIDALWVAIAACKEYLDDDIEEENAD